MNTPQTPRTRVDTSPETPPDGSRLVQQFFDTARSPTSPHNSLTPLPELLSPLAPRPRLAVVVDDPPVLLHTAAAMASPITENDQAGHLRQSVAQTAESVLEGLHAQGEALAKAYQQFAAACVEQREHAAALAKEAAVVRAELDRVLPTVETYVETRLPESHDTVERLARFEARALVARQEITAMRATLRGLDKELDKVEATREEYRARVKARVGRVRIGLAVAVAVFAVVQAVVRLGA